jgi:alpha-L-fucosidase
LSRYIIKKKEQVKIYKKLTGIFILLCLNQFTLKAQRLVFNKQTDQVLLSHWQDLKYGMFVHWMVCHSPQTGDSWSIGNPTPQAVADSITLRWNPEKFDAVSMVDVAVKSGCKYMVIVSKHHDGFAIWDSKYSDWDLGQVKFKRDVLKETGEECRKRGLLFGIYFSIADIHYMGWPKMFADNELSPEPKNGREDFMRYTKAQVKELIDNYNPDILWWDGFWQPPVWTEKEGNELYSYMKSLKSNIICPRLGLTKNSKAREIFEAVGADGDYFAIEGKTIEAAPFPWETASAITYPDYAYEPAGKIISKENLIKTFNNTLCGNGNLLLNIGPKPDGLLAQEQLSRFYDLAAWIKAYKEAVYGTRGGPFKQGAWGGSTFKGKKLYLHLREKTSTIEINTLDQYRVKSVVDLTSGNKLRFENTGDGLTIYLPAYQREVEIPVIKLSLDKAIEFKDWLPLIKN